MAGTCGLMKNTRIINYTALLLFAAAFGYVEAAVVVYLQSIPQFVQHKPYIPDVLLNLGFIAFLAPGAPVLANRFLTTVETVRETATIIMLFSVALLSANTLKRKIGAFLISFSVWDILYYVSLALLTAWPKSLFDTDVFFLIPVPWVGPVLTPVAVSTVLFILGTALYLRQNGLSG